MIPRWQQTIFWVLLVGTVCMAAFLIRMRERAQDRLLTVQDAAPLTNIADAPSVPVTLMIANDADGSLTPMQRSVSLPAEATARTRALLTALFHAYAEPDSSHPLSSLPAIADVYLVPLPAQPSQADHLSLPEQLAVINLNGNFVASHPSGIAVETLTLLSVADTLHANMPQIVQVHFLVDGQQKDTLAGHADLTQNYLTTENPTEAAAGSKP